MSENPEIKRRTIFIVTLLLAVPMFGAGLWVGKSSADTTPIQRPQEGDELAELTADDPLANELAACRRRLARRAQKAAVSTNDVAERREPRQPTPEQQQQIDWLESEIKERMVSAMLHSASVCKTVRRHVDLMMALPDEGKGCRHKFIVVDLIKMNFEKCGQFRDIPFGLDTYDLTVEERNRVLDAVNVAQSITKEELGKLDLIYPACVKKSGRRY